MAGVFLIFVEITYKRYRGLKEKELELARNAADRWRGNIEVSKTEKLNKSGNGSSLVFLGLFDGPFMGIMLSGLCVCPSVCLSVPIWVKFLVEVG